MFYEKVVARHFIFNPLIKLSVARVCLLLDVSDTAFFFFFFTCIETVGCRFEQMLVLLQEQVFSPQRTAAVAGNPRGPPVFGARTRLDEFRASTTLLCLGCADTQLCS